MRSYFYNFLDEFDYDDFSKKSLLDCYNKITKLADTHTVVLQILADYEKDINYPFSEILDKIKTLASALNINEYTAYLTVLICMTKHLKTVYANNGLDEEIWRTAVMDLKYKNTECTLIHGVSGTFVAHWFNRLFNFTRFAFHKLQFQLVSFKDEYKTENLTLRDGDSVIEVHIPRTGTRLDRESMLRSYTLASDFFKEKFNLRPVFVCGSWLLYPENKNLLRPGSNLLLFIHDYDIIKWGDYENYNEKWRLFDTMTDDIDKLPADTSFRRSYIERMRSGKPLGWGYGVFDFEKINN